MDFKKLTVAPLVGVAGCFANKDCRRKEETFIYFFFFYYLLHSLFVPNTGRLMLFIIWQFPMFTNGSAI